MIRFFKSTAFRIFAVIAAALIAGSVFALATRSGSSPLTSAVSFVFSPITRLSSYVAAQFESLPVSFKSSSDLAMQVKELEKKVDSLTEQLVDYEQAKNKNKFYQQFLELLARFVPLRHTMRSRKIEHGKTFVQFPDFRTIII